VTPPELAAIVNPTANPVSITWKLSINSGPQMASLILTATTTATTPACVAASSPVAIIINPKPSTHLTTCFDIKTTTSGKPFLLRGGTPIGAEGRYYIDQTTNPPVSMFNPATAGAGIHTIHYGYTNINGCVAYDSKQINVIQAAGFSCGGVVTDPRDGNHYNTVQIGSQCWMQENLNYGVSIGTPGLTQTDNCVTEKFCLPPDINCGTYGALYQWDELMAYGFISQNQGICMPGWHVPSESEWQTMINIISSGITPPADGIAGGFIKDTTRNPGFYALTRGIYFMNNRWAFSNEKPKGTMFWTSTTYGPGHGVSRGVNVPNPSVSRYSGSRGNAFSVRCVKD
jgi:uncharacterized protein (TIGR02145 family)